MSSHVVLTFRYSSGSHLNSMLKTSLSADLSTRKAQIVVEFDGFDAGGGDGGKSVKKLSKSRGIVNKSKENLKGLKSCKGHRFRGTFTKAPILRQFIDIKNSSS